MDWFHCNRCFRTKGPKFFVSSCGHICCERCINSKQCNVCAVSCNYLSITNEMKPQEGVFFKDPVKLIQTRLEHITQIALFQKKQKERVAAYFKHRAAEMERRLKEVTEQGYRQISDLKRENAELKKPFSQRRVSPGQFQTSSAHRISLPVAVTPPLTPRTQSMGYPGSAEALGRATGSMRSLTSPPGSVLSVSSHSSHQNAFRTPTSHITPTRTGNQTPNIFQFQFNRSSLQSPRLGRNGH